MPTKKRGSEESIEITQEQNKVRSHRTRALERRQPVEEQDDQVVRSGEPINCASGYPWCPYPC
eukprot:2247128-Rhodomonas_salina.1